ncbi:MAG TPA: hypothetical protein VEK07_08160 [Polyangiaceae bacterium]|nr:hypothetical protein [Polyangiaceae bacterium]
MAGAVRDPGLGLACGKCDRDERCAQVVGAEALTRVRALVELRALDSDAAQVVADLFGQVLDVQRHALFGEDAVARLGMRLRLLLPALERLHHVGSQIPVARIIGLVLLEADASVLQVDVSPAKPRHLLSAHPLACQKAVGHAAQKGHVGQSASLADLYRPTGEQLGILARVQTSFAFRGGREGSQPLGVGLA